MNGIIVESYCTAVARDIPFISLSHASPLFSWESETMVSRAGVAKNRTLFYACFESHLEMTGVGWTDIMRPPFPCMLVVGALVVI